METKLLLRTFATAMLFLLLGCRTELETELGKTNPNATHDRISFSQFKNETRTKDLKQNFLSLAKNAKTTSKENQIQSLYRIDTLNINRLDFDKKTTYSFRAYNIFESPDKRYNLVYFYKNGKWNFSILELLENNKSKPVYDSRFGEIKIAENSQAGRACLMPYTSYSYHCTHTGDCAGGVCDGCKLCISETSGYVYADCGGGGGGSGGGSGTENPGDSGGGQSNPSPDPSGYTYDPYIEPNTDTEYVRAVRAANFWQQVPQIVYGATQWANEHPDLYCNVLEDYLDNYSITDNTKNLNFANWAIGFLAENTVNGVCNVSWEQFENWFINGTLSIGLMTEFISDLNNPNIVKPTKRFKANTKINAVYNHAKTAANFNQYLKNFELTFSVAHLLFDIGNVNNSTWLAYTSPPQNYWIKTTFNQDKDWSNIPKIVIAETFMHEMIHAEIYRKLLSLASINGNIDINSITQQMLNHNYPGLFDYYVRYTKDSTDAQHNLMGAHYVSIMVNFLKQVYGTQYSDLVYKSIVWLDMKNTTAWNLLPQSERNLYQQTWDLNYWSWEK